jgi:hypothetical protein
MVDPTGNHLTPSMGPSALSRGAEGRVVDATSGPYAPPCEAMYLAHPLELPFVRPRRKRGIQYLNFGLLLAELASLRYVTLLYRIRPVAGEVLRGSFHLRTFPFALHPYLLLRLPPESDPHPSPSPCAPPETTSASRDSLTAPLKAWSIQFRPALSALTGNL